MIRIFRGIKDKRAKADEVCRELWGCKIIRLESGRPLLENGVREISISHTGDILAIMDSSERCGVDIEKRNRRSEHIARKFATHSEIEICNSVFPENPTLLIWCAKEALYKYMSREGVDFIKDMQITHSTNNKLTAKADSKVVTLGWYTDDDLLIVHTIL